ncbi:acyl-CoA dehydrogenase, partial [Streptomyces microflavus]|uniref:acyl-CoA dehydrogenase n=2 Tax=Streptomyces TaxID=1883 RepID=UPI003680401B
MGHYKSNLRDIEFNLFEVLGRDKLYGTGPFAEMDVDTAKSILDEVVRLAENELADSFADADRNPPVFDPETNTAPVPESFRKSYQSFMDSEYWRLGLPEEIGGTTAPRSLIWGYAELLLGANPAVWMYSSGPAFAGILFEEGTEEQKKVAEIAVEKQWGSTMVLTEPDAGSDVGAGRTKAVQQEDGSWHIEGVKRFITSGEHDMSENILHYVLARPEGAGPGTKGLSLFLVPKYHFDWTTGELGERNGVYATNVEHKMGLKASNTCEMTFGDRHPAKGWLIGDKHDGIRQMFRIIEFARMMVGTKAIATLSTGYLNALEYAKERVQGTDLSQFMDKTAPKVTITHHPDVRRSLMTQKAYAEGMRSLVLYTATVQDAIQEKEAAGEDAKALNGLNDLLLPIVKGYGSEKSYEQLAQSLQTFGGSGYLQEYPVEQYIRDAKIDTLYEGTTAIQGQDFFFRKIVRDQGVSLNTLSEEIKKFLAGAQGNEELAPALDSLAKAAVDLEAIVGTMITDLTATGEDVKNIYKVGLNTTRLLMASGDVVVGYLLLKGATVAAEKLPSASAKDVAFYQGKIAAAKFFAANILPGVGGGRARAADLDNTQMGLVEGAGGVPAPQPRGGAPGAPRAPPPPP